MLWHLANGEEWKEFDRLYLSFSSDTRNVQLDLDSDGFYLFDNMSNSYSIWSVIFVFYNLPS